MKRLSIVAALFLLCVLSRSPSLFAWAESGHAIISYLAYTQLSDEQKRVFDELLLQHPNWKIDFSVPEAIPAGIEQKKWVIGRTGYWPDIAREYEEYNRPNWHYQLGAALTLGNMSGIPVPEDPITLPPKANMETQELYVLQALELCRKELANRENSADKRAIALCWVVHLIADLHLPCHSGSLYAESVFSDESGDRGANRIKVGDQTLHALWDQLLGNIYDRSDVNRRLYELTSDPQLVERGTQAVTQMEPHVWLLESRSVAEQYLYTAEVRQAVRAAMEAKRDRLPKLRLTESYGKSAGRIAQVRAVESAARLAKVLDESL